MAKGKYEKWLEPEWLLLLEAWARDGLTDEQISNKMGISRKTLYEWCKKYGDICNTLKRGKDVVDAEVENSLLKLARDGNITAIIFWLKNRRPDKWRDKPSNDNAEIMEKLDAVIGEIDNVAAK